ncbi:MAG: zinc ribbon domain-containing protein [Chloroflexi bacterium]|nr:zinc ribbon domain-containing protein [Chloroflexota bacterium]
MAIYEYFCPGCNREFEVMRSMKDADAPARCPVCQGPGKKLVSVFGSSAAGGFGVKVPEKGPYRGSRRQRQ